MNLRRATATALLLLAASPALAGCQELTDAGLIAAEAAANSEQGQAVQADAATKACDFMRSKVSEENWPTLQESGVCPEGSTGSTGGVPTTTADPASVATAATALTSIPVVEESAAARAAYSGKREELYGSAWPDLDRDRCSERQEILQRDLTGEKLASDQCTVLRGTLDDPYTGTVINFVHDREGGDSAAVQIDHIVPLGQAHRSGADAWTKEMRVAFANDPANLLASDGPANEKKGDKDLAQWMVPGNPDYRCDYTVQYVNVKAAYGLSMDAAEHAAAQKMLAQCA